MLNDRAIAGERGVTLIEMLIALAVLGILMSVAYPSYLAWLQNTQIRNAAESLQNALQLARTEAVRRNGFTQFVLDANAAQPGKTTWTTTLLSDNSVIQSQSGTKGYPNVTTTASPGGATTVTFNAFGRVVPNGDNSASITQLDIDVPASVLSAADSRNLRVTVSAGGQVRMCDPNVAAGDPRAC